MSTLETLFPKTTKVLTISASDDYSHAYQIQQAALELTSFMASIAVAENSGSRKCVAFY